MPANKKGILVCIVGGSGSGKTTLAQALFQKLGAPLAGLLSADRYYKHRPDLSVEERARANYDRPQAVDDQRLVSDVRRLVAGETVEVPNYSFTTHLREDKTDTIEPCPIIIVEGVLIGVIPDLMEMCDLLIYVDTPVFERCWRRIFRDFQRRGRNPLQTITQLAKTVLPGHYLYVAPVWRFANLVIPTGGESEKVHEILCDYLRAQVQNI